jgi:methionyl aminopeptidase
MITIKSAEEIKILAEGGKILGRILRDVAKMAVPGASTRDIDAFVAEEIKKAGGKPSFLGYGNAKNPYPCAICISINDEVVHGIAMPEKILKEGDIVGLDVGMCWPSCAKASKGGPMRPMFTDMAATVGVGKIKKEGKKLIKVTREALSEGLKKVKAGGAVSDIGRAIQQYVEKHGFNVVRDLVGHGVGYAVHEDPRVPNYYDPQMESVKLKEGMVLAIEPMVVAGDWRVRESGDGWTIVTADGGNAAHFEVTVVVTKKGCIILTPLPQRLKD